MPSAGEHLTQARHNQDLAEQLINENPLAYADWAVTVAFYTALHYVKYFRASRGLSVGDSHDEIDGFFRMPELRPLQRYYRGMKDDCWGARYQCVIPTPIEAIDLVRNQLDRVRQPILRLCPPPA